MVYCQKINKYKRKYRENISVGKFSRDFTDGNIPSVYTEGITMGKKLKQKKWWHVIFTNDIIDGITDGISSVGKFVGKNMNTIHHVNYKGNHQRNCPSVFSRELQNCSLFNCTVNCYSLRTKSPTDWKVVGVI